MKFEIKNYWNASILFSLECDSMKLCVEAAVRSGADLRGADLSGADLRGAVFDIKPATEEQAIANLDKVREIILDKEDRLNMGHWHGDSEWKNRTCAEETLCGTSHCLAGWLQTCSTRDGIKDLSPATAGYLEAPVAHKMFYRGNADALEWLRDRKYVEELKEKA